MKLRVAYIVRDLYGSGGIQYFSRNASEGLDSKHTLVKLLDWRSPLSITQEIIVRILPKPLSKKIYSLWFKQDISSVLIESEWDIIHFWHIKPAMAVIDSINLPYVLTCHGSEILKPRVASYQYNKFIKTLEKASAIIVNSRFTKDYLATEYDINTQKISIVHPGINLDKFRPRESDADPKTTMEIGTLTRLIPRKNIPNIIKALGLLKERGIDFQYSLAGTAPFINRMVVLRQLKKSNFKWRYLGEIKNDIKETEFYPYLDVFVLPTLKLAKDIEGFGIVFLEANASGVPVVAADNGGVSDAVRPGVSGIFADPVNPEDISDKIYDILNSKKNYKKSSRLWAERFSQEKTAERLQMLYEKLGQKS